MSFYGKQRFLCPALTSWQETSSAKLPACYRAEKKKAINISLSGPLSGTGHLGGTAPYWTGKTVNKEKRNEKRQVQSGCQVQNTWYLQKQIAWIPFHFLTWYEDCMIPACFCRFPCIFWRHQPVKQIIVFKAHRSTHVLKEKCGLIKHLLR